MITDKMQIQETSLNAHSEYKHHLECVLDAFNEC